MRTYQEFATADLVSGGRVEIIFGRGAFSANFPLFGFDLKDYDALFAEKFELTVQANYWYDGQHTRTISWGGRYDKFGPSDERQISREAGAFLGRRAEHCDHSA